MFTVSESTFKMLRKGITIGLTLASSYTAAFMLTKKSGCSHAPAEDPVMRIVRGITGATIGGVAGKVASDYIFRDFNKEDTDGTEDR